MGYGDGGNALSISPDDFNAFEMGSTGMCVVGAFFALDLGEGGDGVPSWVVGDSFLKNVYSVYRFNPPSVGFADLSLSMNGPSDGSSNGALGAVHAPLRPQTLSLPSQLVLSLLVLEEMPIVLVPQEWE
ncbi:hypothetical protein VKT23_020593 [Stygiomarasmius scandens]|uniref:Peptidase A1 domain-containing protein n=1 Tax=Marasmiellus scandens TaxID=2682957 RepID=A0ABR1IIT4_9AGAR